MTVIAKKVCLIGDFGVGKTSLIRRFVDRQFSDQYLSTVGVKISKKIIEVESTPDPRSLQLLIWDIEGHTKFKSISSNYLQGATGAVIVGDLTRQETLEQLSKHTQDFLLVNPGSFTMVALNKADLVDAELQEKLVQHYRLRQQTGVLECVPTSARTGVNVDYVFERLATQILE